MAPCLSVFVCGQFIGMRLSPHFLVFSFFQITSDLGYVSCTNQIATLGHVSHTNQSVVFALWFERCSNFNEVMGDSQRAVHKMESSFRMRNVSFSVFLTCILPLFMRNVIQLVRRYQITCRKEREKMESCALSAIMVIVPSQGECVEKF